MSLNIAHGRGLSLNQILVNRLKTRDNLNHIGSFLLSVEGDIVGLQEADMPSSWSGNFNHVEFLAGRGRYPQFIHAPHADIKIGHYGTAIISRLPILAGFGLTFSPSPPTMNKGLTLAEIDWKTKNGTVAIAVISVHLDFSRESVRQQQLAEIRETLSALHMPVIVMGDFNSESLVSQLTSGSEKNWLSLHTYYDSTKDLSTYKQKRLDWILLSNDFVFESYRVSPVELSDHLAVIATVRLTSLMDDN
ncbi:MAG: endonuclease/exonuclease/phosphatase family protein [Desulfocapsaceae bacterium]